MRSRLGGFLLPTTCVVRSTGHPGVSRPSDIYSCNEVRIALKPALSATKPGLVRPIFRGGVPTRGTGPARILRGNRYEHTAFPGQLVFQLAAELEPSLVEDGFVQAGLGPNVPSGMLDCSSG